MCSVESKPIDKLASHRPGISGPVIASFVVALGLMIGGGTAFRVLGSYLDRPTDTVPMTSEELGRLPMDVGLWHGRDVPMDDRVVRATACDAYVNRAYQRGVDSVALYVAYGVRARDLMPHRPEVCYREAGYSQRSSEEADLTLADGTTLPCRVYRFEKGGLGVQAVTVLNYYIVDGAYCPDVSLLRSKAAHGSAGVRYTAQVQITSSTDHQLSGGSEDRAVRDFAAEAASKIRSLLPGPSDSAAAESASQARSSEGPGS
jgi:EpsI family protein